MPKVPLNPPPSTHGGDDSGDAMRPEDSVIDSAGEEIAGSNPLLNINRYVRRAVSVADQWVEVSPQDIPPQSMARDATTVFLSDIFGWKDDRSPTGWLCGIVDRLDSANRRVHVTYVRTAIFRDL